MQTAITLLLKNVMLGYCAMICDNKRFVQVALLFSIKESALLTFGFNILPRLTFIFRYLLFILHMFNMTSQPARGFKKYIIQGHICFVSFCCRSYSLAVHKKSCFFFQRHACYPRQVLATYYLHYKFIKVFLVEYSYICVREIWFCFTPFR